MRRHAVDLLSILFAVGALYLLAFAGDGFPDPDGYYHVRFADLMARGEVPHGSFPWASASTWATAFSDKDWLFHVALVPFVRLFDPIVGGKVATATFSSLLVITLAFVLHRRGAPRPGLLALIALFGSYGFLQRVILTRTLTLAIVLLLLLTWALTERRARLAFVIALLYPLTYAAIFVPVALALVALLVERAKGDTRSARGTVLATCAGTLLGIALHPDFPLNLGLAWDQNVRVLANAWAGTRLGLVQANEFTPYLIREAAHGSFVALLAIAASVGVILVADPVRPLKWARLIVGGLVVALVAGVNLDEGNTRHVLLLGAPVWGILVVIVGRSAVRAPGIGKDSLFALMLAVAALAGGALSARFFEYVGPLAVLAFGLLARDALAAPSVRVRIAEGLAASRMLQGLVASAIVLVAFHSLVSNGRNVYRFAREAQVSRFEPAARWLSANARPGEVIFHDRWGAAPDLFYYAPGLRYLVLLDPAFLFYADEDHRRFNLWDEVVLGQRSPDEVRAFDGCRFIVRDAQFARSEPLRKRLEKGGAVLRQTEKDVEVWELTR